MSLKNLLALQAQKKATESPPAAGSHLAPKGLGLNLATKAPPKTVEVESVTQSDTFSLEDLASISTDVVPVVDSPEDPMFPDEIEATAPDRELPDDITAEQISFVESLDGIYGVLHDSEMFGQTVRMIMIELQDNPEYDRLLSDSDVHTMIRGMRRTMGLARVRKQEKSRKVGTNKNARKTSGVSDDAMQLLNSLMGGGDD
jgi:hypothetical protein